MSPISKALFDHAYDNAIRAANGQEFRPLNASELQTILDGMGAIPLEKPKLTLVKG